MPRKKYAQPSARIELLGEIGVEASGNAVDVPFDVLPLLNNEPLRALETDFGGRPLVFWRVIDFLGRHDTVGAKTIATTGK